MRQSRVNAQPDDLELTNTAHKILQQAALLIAKKGRAKVAIREIADAARVSSALVHSLIGRSEQILEKIILHFLLTANKEIKTALKYQPTYSTPVVQLIKLFEATLDVFEDHQIFGKAVLRELTIPRESPDHPIFRIFHLVDQIISEAKKLGEFNEYASNFADWEIRQTLFGLTYGLLRCRYLEEGKPHDHSSLSSQKLKILVLKYLQTFCAQDAQHKIEEEINASNARYSQRSSDESN